MTTVQAFWFRADDDERGLDPDYEAFTAMDVLNVVRRLTGRRSKAPGALHLPRGPVKTCGGRRPGRQSRDSQCGADVHRDRASPPTAGGDRVSALRGALRQGRLPGRLRRARMPVPLRLPGVGPHVRRLHAEGLRGRDRPRAPRRGARAQGRLRRRSGRSASRCRCAGPRSRAATSTGPTSAGASTPSFSSSPAGRRPSGSSSRATRPRSSRRAGVQVLEALHLGRVRAVSVRARRLQDRRQPLNGGVREERAEPLAQLALERRSRAGRGWSRARRRRRSHAGSAGGRGRSARRRRRASRRRRPGR